MAKNKRNPSCLNLLMAKNKRNSSAATPRDTNQTTDTPQTTKNQNHVFALPTPPPSKTQSPLITKNLASPTSKNQTSSQNPTHTSLVSSSSQRKFLFQSDLDLAIGYSKNDDFEDELDYSLSDEDGRDALPSTFPIPAQVKRVTDDAPSEVLVSSKTARDVMVFGMKLKEGISVDASKPSKPTEPLVKKWRDLFSSNRGAENCNKLKFFSHISIDKCYSILKEDLDSCCNVWKSCIVEYVGGKFPSYRALNDIALNYIIESS